jgi:hypothetical protein
LGAVTGSLLNENRNASEPLALDDWQSSGLPWIGCWIKELLAWGTLDPAASYLLSKQIVETRTEAAARAVQYYENASIHADPRNRELLDPRRIRDWVQMAYPQSGGSEGAPNESPVAVELTRQFSETQLATTRRVFSRGVFAGCLDFLHWAHMDAKW